MNNRDFAKLAMMGLVGGCLLGSSPAAAQESTNSQGNNKGVLLAHSCGAGCNGRGSRSYVADNSDDSGREKPIRNSNDSSSMYDSNKQTASGCGSKSRPSNGCGSQRSQVADNGCGTKQSRPSNGCNQRYVSDNDSMDNTKPDQSTKDKMSIKRDSMNQSNQSSNQTSWNRNNQNQNRNNQSGY